MRTYPSLLTNSPYPSLQSTSPIICSHPPTLSLYSLTLSPTFPNWDGFHRRMPKSVPTLKRSSWKEEGTTAVLHQHAGPQSSPPAIATGRQPLPFLCAPLMLQSSLAWVFICTLNGVGKGTQRKIPPRSLLDRRKGHMNENRNVCSQKVGSSEKWKNTTASFSLPISNVIIITIKIIGITLQILCQALYVYYHI